MSAVLDVATGVLLLAGAALCVAAGVGLHRFPDVFGRMHAATKPATLGLVLVAAAAVLQVDDAGDVAKLALVVVLQFLTAPVGAHLVGRAAHEAGTEVAPGTVLDELAAARGRGDGSGTAPDDRPG